MVYSVQDAARAPMMVQNQNPEAGMLHNQKSAAWPWPTSQQEGSGAGESAHGIDLPSFDSEAHRKFMRSLG